MVFLEQYKIAYLSVRHPPLLQFAPLTAQYYKSQVTSQNVPCRLP